MTTTATTTDEAIDKLFELYFDDIFKNLQNSKKSFTDGFYLVSRETATNPEAIKNPEDIRNSLKSLGIRNTYVLEVLTGIFQDFTAQKMNTDIQHNKLLEQIDNIFAIFQSSRESLREALKLILRGLVSYKSIETGLARAGIVEDNLRTMLTKATEEFITLEGMIDSHGKLCLQK